MPTIDCVSIQKDSVKEPSVEEEQAKEAALRKEAIYQQKIAAWKQSVQAKADAEYKTDAKKVKDEIEAANSIVALLQPPPWEQPQHFAEGPADEPPERPQEGLP